jgi:hypothetical protein
MLARAAEAFVDCGCGKIQRPSEISDANWSYFMKARGTRIRKLDQRLHEIERHARELADDPVAAHLGANPEARR